jgi:hypothetical protein
MKKIKPHQTKKHTTKNISFVHKFLEKKNSAIFFENSFLFHFHVLTLKIKKVILKFSSSQKKNASKIIHLSKN